MQETERKAKLRKALAFAGRLTSILLLSTFLVLSDDQRAAIAKAIADPLAILEGRSPGARDEARLRQSKQGARMSPLSDDLLESDIVIPPEAFDSPSDIFTDNSESPLVPGPTKPAPAGEGAQAAADIPPAKLAFGGGTGGGGFIIGTGGGLPGGGGGDGPGGGIDCGDDGCGVPTGGTDTPPTIIPVPEPSTWLLIIAGFMSLGGVMRGVRRAQARPASAKRTA